MRRRDILDLIEEGENITCEFKQRFTSPEKIAKSITAFANTNGGVLLFGVEDDKRVTGVDSEKSVAEMIAYTAEKHCEPSVELAIEYFDIDGAEVVAAIIPESVQKPHRIQDYKRELDITTATVYVRVHDTSVQASKEMIRVMRSTAGNTTLTKYVIGTLERTVFEYLEKCESITVKELGGIANISERRAGRTLVKMVRAGLLLIHSRANGETFFTASKAAS